MSDYEVHEKLGNLAARMSGLEDRFEKIEGTLGEVHESMHQVVGGFRAVKIVATAATAAAAAIGAGCTKLLGWVTG